ncbi:hypothetical protein D9M71_360210 [compost metagenome]
MEGAALPRLGLLHGDMRVPEQRIGAIPGMGVGQAQAAAEQQALAVHPVRLAEGVDDPLGNPLGTPGIVAGIEQQGEFVAAQASQVVTVFQLLLEAGDHLQDQPVAGLVAKGVVDVAEVVQVQVTEDQAAAAALAEAGGEQGMHALAIGDAGQRVLLGQALQGVLQAGALMYIAQAAAQHFAAQLPGDQPVADAMRGLHRLGVEQQDQRQLALQGRGPALRSRQQQIDLLVTASSLPGRRRDQRIACPQRGKMLAQQLGPLRSFRQQQQARRFNQRSQTTPDSIK